MHDNSKLYVNVIDFVDHAKYNDYVLHLMKPTRLIIRLKLPL